MAATADPVNHSNSSQIPPFLRNKPTIQNVEEATAILSSIDKAFKIDGRNESGLKDYFQTLYKKVPKKDDDEESTSGLTAGEEFHPSAFAGDDNDDEEISAEELKERDSVLEAGRSRALEIGAKPVAAVPADVARVIQECCWTFRRAWSEGHHSLLDKAWLKANEKIEGLNSVAKRDKDMYKVPHRAILSLIPIIRAVAGKWAVAKATNTDTSDHSKNVAALTLNLLGVLADHGLGWKAITPGAVKDVIVEICMEGSPQLGAQVMESLNDYLTQDTVNPSSLQMHIAAKAQAPLKEIFKNTELGNLPAIDQSFSELVSINQEIQNENKAVCFKENDHALPVAEIKTFLSGDEFDKLTPETGPDFVVKYKEYIAYYLNHIGYAMLASTLVSKANLKSIEAPPGLQMRIESLHSEYAYPVDENADKSTNQDASDLFVRDGELEKFQESQSKSTVTGLRKSTVAGPFLRDRVTALGKISTVEPVAANGTRCIVDIGTENFPVYISIPGSEFGRGLRDELLEFRPKNQIASTKGLKATAIKELKAVFQIGQKKASDRQPITKFLVSWKPEVVGKNVASESWVSRSDLNAICGKKFMDREGGRLIEDWKHNVNFLESMRVKGQHPETGKPLTEEDWEKTPWLCPNMAPSSKEENSTSINDPMEIDKNDHSSTDHIVNGSRKLGVV